MSLFFIRDSTRNKFLTKKFGMINKALVFQYGKENNQKIQQAFNNKNYYFMKNIGNFTKSLFKMQNRITINSPLC